METKKLLLFVAFALAAGSAYCCGEDCGCCDWAEEAVEEKATKPEEAAKPAEATKPVVVAAKEEEKKEEESKPETVKLVKNEVQKPAEDSKSEEGIEDFDYDKFKKFADKIQTEGVAPKKT